MKNMNAVKIFSILMVLVYLSACGGAGAGGGGGSSTSAIPSKIVFSENGNIYSVGETGGASAVALADTLEEEAIAMGRASIDAELDTNSYTGNANANFPPMVKNGRAVIQQRYTASSYQDIYAVNLDGSQRVALAASTDVETPFALVGDRLVYTAVNTTAYTQNLRSVRLDGSGDVAITSVPFPNHARAVAFAGTKLIYYESSGSAYSTYISDADGSNRITLWNKAIYSVQVSGNRLVLFTGGELAAVNLDGTGFVTLATNVGGGGAGIAYSGWSPFFGIAAGRVFYKSIDSTTTPSTIRLHSVALDGTNPLVLATSTTSTTNPYVMAVSNTRLIVNESIGSAFNIVSYDISRANSRLLLLENHTFMFMSGNRLAGFQAVNTANNTYAVSAVNLDGSAATLLTPEIKPIDNYYRLVHTSGGKLIYSHTPASGQIEGYSVNLDGTGTTLLTTVAGDKELMAISGDRLIYQGYAKGNTTAPRNLYGVKLDGSGTVDYATTASDERYLGKYSDKLLFTSTNAGIIELKLVPLAGGTGLNLQSSTYTKTFVGAY